MRYKQIKRIIIGIISIMLLIVGFNSSVIAESDNTRISTTSFDSMVNTTVSNEVNDGLTDAQRNSIAMLNYLTVLNQEINTSKNSKLFLEEVYDVLISNTYPTAIDERTQIQLDDMLDTIERYRMIDVKRDRLQYIYEQNKAQAIRAAVPNPMGLLSATVAFDWQRVITSVVYMAIDSKTSYDSAMAQADMKYLQDNWALDDEASAAMHQSRKQLFNYMVDIVQDNNLPGEYTLSEKAVDEFVEYKNDDNIYRRISSLESNESTYRHFGGYWLLLAKSYYENNDYDSCIDALSKYESIQTKIFRKDYDYANTLPLAIYSVQQISNDKKYIESSVRRYLDALINNIDTKDWALRYFAAQTYVYLFSLSNKEDDLKNAYELVSKNITDLAKEQQRMNTVYLTDIVKVTVPADATKDQKKDINNYNKLLEEARKVELPPIYEPLYLNCELLFSLAEKIGLSGDRKAVMDKMLHGSQQEALFLNYPLDNCFWFEERDNVSSFASQMEKNSIVIPAYLVSDLSSIKVTITSTDGSVFEADDWIVKKVNRKKSNNIEDFEVTYTSESIKQYKYKDGDNVVIEIIPVPDSKAEPKIIKYTVSVKKKYGFIDDTSFKMVK